MRNPLDFLLAVSLAMCCAAAAETPSVATKYPNDAGIEKDPAVLFTENFESGNLKKWEDKKGPVSLTPDQPHSGSACLAIRMTRGKDTGGHLIHWFMPGSETVYVRFYVKFSKDYQYSHHFIWLGANPANNRWHAFGKAGLKPDGTYFSTGMEPWFAWGKNPPPGEVSFYSYYMDMQVDPKMNKYWGNSFFPPGPDKGKAASPNRIIPPLDKWQCWEFMMQANSTPDKADGKQAMWIDGKLAGEFTGLRWRSNTDLKINTLWLEHFGYDDSDPTKQFWKDHQTAWFDDIVVAKQYIGPMTEK